MDPLASTSDIPGSQAGGSKPFRVCVVSDTHGRLKPDLLMMLAAEHPDAIVHAGDMCNFSDYERLCEIAPVYACLGNNDWPGDTDPNAKNNLHLDLGGVRWEVCHYREKLDMSHADVGVCGHTHRPSVEETQTGAIIINPGSPSSPRSSEGPTFGRVIIRDGQVESAEIIHLPGSGSKTGIGFWR